MRLGAGIRHSFEELKQKPLRHWLTALAILVACFLGGPYLEDYLGLRSAEYWIFETLTRLSIGTPKPHFVSIVLVGDDEYWLGTPAGRRPTNRSYLAALLKSLESSRAAVIAIDFDLRSPDPSSPLVLPLYREETDELMREIATLAEKHKVVLAKSIWTDERSGDYILDPDVYQAYGICATSDSSGRWHSGGTSTFSLSRTASANIECGYVALPYDMRLVPGRIGLAEGKYLDSFSLSIARSINASAAEEAADMNLGGYMPQSAWTDAKLISQAEHLSRDIQADPQRFANRVIILGAGWNSLARGRGDPVDYHATPAGKLVGPLIHANFVETILGKRTFRPTADWLPEACEIIFGILAALIFSLEHTAPQKILALVGVSAGLVTIQWILLQTIGILFEALVPMFGLWLHSMVERLIGEQEEGEHEAEEHKRDDHDREHGKT